MKISKLFHGIRTLKDFKENPLGFILDLLLGVILSALIPIPFIGAVITRYKGIILWMIGGMIVSVILIVVAVFIALFTPIVFLFSPHTGTGSLSTGLQGNAIAQALNGYIESGFSDTDVPQKNPFGGLGMLNTYTTVSFHEQEDFTLNSKAYSEIEQGIDLVPDGLYFLTNKAAKLTGEPIIFSTITGTTHIFIDGYGALTVVVTNNKGTIKTVYIHLSQFLVGDNTAVRAGQPIGVMGSTGMSTGPHLEYQVRVNNGGNFSVVNPADYIH